MDPLTFFILIIAGIYFYSQGSIFFAFLTAILVLILVLTSGGSLFSGGGKSHGGHGGGHGHAAPMYPEKMTIEIGDIDHGSSGAQQLGTGLYNTAYFIGNGLKSVLSWGKEKDEDKPH